jgi:hypothetical protein
LYVPSALAVHVPVTSREPESFTGVHIEGSSPAAEMSRLAALNFTHDELTVHVPTTLPPHAVTLGHDDPPPAPVELPVPAEPLELPPAPVRFEPGEHAPDSAAAAIAIVKTAACTFIDGTPCNENSRVKVLVLGALSFLDITAG